MLRIIVEFLTKVGLSIEIKLVKLLQQEQRLILDEFSHVQRCFLLFRHKGPQSINAQCKTVKGVGCTNGSENGSEVIL
ncbi:Uncharacterised protein [Klebsiella pneumoniae]|nr:Uncharacterised protein [Klebsiella pneumoniae]